MQNRLDGRTTIHLEWVDKRIRIIEEYRRLISETRLIELVRTVQIGTKTQLDLIWERIEYD